MQIYYEILSGLKEPPQLKYIKVAKMHKIPRMPKMHKISKMSEISTMYKVYKMSEQLEIDDRLKTELGMVSRQMIFKSFEQ